MCDPGSHSQEEEVEPSAPTTESHHWPLRCNGKPTRYSRPESPLSGAGPIWEGSPAGDGWGLEAAAGGSEASGARRWAGRLTGVSSLNPQTTAVGFVVFKLGLGDVGL